MEISQLLEYLQCPDCQNKDLIIRDNKIICATCGIKYDIVENIPILICRGKLNEQEKKQTVWFDRHYSEFSRDDYRLENWRQSMLNRIFERKYKREITTYLDIGCGATGYTVIEGVRRNGWISIGTDISLEAMIRANNLAKRQGVSDKSAFVVCAAENLPFKANTFNYISAISILEHLQNDNKAIENIICALKPEGYIYICVPNTYRRMWPFLWPVYYYNDLKIGHKRHYSIEQLDNYFLSQHRCSRNEVFYNGHLVKFYQILLEKFNKINDKKWWELEAKDINLKNNGVQLNAIYYKK
jgi:ubiquinone/menaquinone biosynthesis C-methylase UbiE